MQNTIGLFPHCLSINIKCIANERGKRKQQRQTRLKSTSCSHYRSFRYGSCWYSFLSFRRIFSKIASERRLNVVLCVQKSARGRCVHIISTLKSNLFCNPSKYCAFHGKFSIMCIMFARDVLRSPNHSWAELFNCSLECVNFFPPAAITFY